MADPETGSARAKLPSNRKYAILNSFDSKSEFNSRTGRSKQTAGRQSSMDQNIVLKQIDQQLVKFTNEFKPPDVPYAIPKFDLGLDLAFESDPEKSRLKRNSCPSSVGNMGFNSFNFLTFMVMVFNAVANANNNINNNVSMYQLPICYLIRKLKSLLSFWLKIDESLKIRCSQKLSISYCWYTSGHLKTCFGIFITLHFFDL